MHVVKKVDRGEPYGEFEAIYGFARKLFDAQSKVPRLVEAEQWLLRVVLEGSSGLDPQDKIAILNGSLPLLPSRAWKKESLPIALAEKLTAHPFWVNRSDIDRLKDNGFNEATILETVLTTALGRFLRTLADGLLPGLCPVGFPDSFDGLKQQALEWIETPGPYLSSGTEASDDCASSAILRDQFGFVPDLLRTQNLRPDVVEAEVFALNAIVFSEDLLNRIQKERIMLAVSASNLNSYGVSLHSQVLSALGVREEESDQIISDQNSVALPAAELALLEFARSLCGRRNRTDRPVCLESLYEHGFSELQAVESVATCAFANFLDFTQFGIGTLPDFPARHTFTPKDLYPSEYLARPISEVEDPDATLVEQSKNGDTSAFEELVRRNTKRVFGTLAGLLGSIDEAQDAVQDVFLKAFEHLDGFQGRSKFSTWLVSIAINTGTEVLRQRKTFESLDQNDDEEFRPRQLQSWTDSPEKLVSAEQTRTLVREGVMRLPEIYRVAVLLRDINQLSSEEAAAVLGLSVPALKARVLRGRLMLRESLAPHFARPHRRSSNA